jgi:hypothetical protein
VLLTSSRACSKCGGSSSGPGINVTTNLSYDNFGRLLTTLGAGAAVWTAVASGALAGYLPLSGGTVQNANTGPSTPIPGVASTSATGQAVLGFAVNGTTQGVLRGDFAGNLTLNAAAGIDLITGGLYPSETGGISIDSSGNVTGAATLNADVETGGCRPLDLRLPPFNLAAAEVYQFNAGIGGHKSTLWHQST